MMYQLKKALGLPTRHRIGDAILHLPGGHALPKYQSQFPTYDAFLPILAQFLPEGSRVIDVGANVGDTIAGMASANRSLTFVAVEPDDQFAKYLIRNIAIMKEEIGSFDVSVINAFISNGLEISGLQGENGTRKAVIGERGPSSATENLALDALMDRFPVGSTSLIKVDTDGYDWSVIESGYDLIARDVPLIFFETEVGDAFEHLERYKTVIAHLAKKYGYSFTVFDNFGLPICSFQKAESLIEMLHYLTYTKMTKRRSIFYFDILASVERQSEIVNAAIGTWSTTFAPK